LRSDFIGWENFLKTKIFGIVMLQKRGKPCPISKKVREKGGKWMSDLKKMSNLGLDRQIK